MVHYHHDPHTAKLAAAGAGSELIDPVTGATYWVQPDPNDPSGPWLAFTHRGGEAVDPQPDIASLRDFDPGLEGFAEYQPDNLVHLPTGAPIERLRAQVDDLGNSETTYFYRDENGDLQMTTNNQTVGRNDAPNLIQLIGTTKVEIFDAAADTTLTAADIRGLAATNSMKLRGYKSDGTEVEVAFDTATHFIGKIAADLKPVQGGAGDISESDGRAIASEASYSTDGTEFQNIDPGGSRDGGNLIQAAQNGGWYIRPDFDQTGIIKVAAGSVMEITIVGMSAPTDEATL